MLSLVIPDVHAPFHCKRSWKYLLRLLDDTAPEEIVILGDFFDLHALTTHRQDPRWQDNLERELSGGAKLLAELRDHAKDARIRYIQGNHEDRWNRYVSGRIPAMRLIGVDLPRYVDLASLDIQWIEDARKTAVRVPCGQGKKVRCFHGHEVKGRLRLAERLAEQTGENIHIGHTHKLAGPIAVKVGGKELFAVEGGHLANDKHGVFDYAGLAPNWRKALALYDSNRKDTPYPYLVWPR